MKMNAVSKVILRMGVLLAIMLFVAGGAYAGSIELKLALYIPSTSAQYKAYQWWADQVQKRSEGRVKIKMFPGQQICTSKEMPDAIATGLTDIGSVSPTYTPAKTALHSIGHLPMLAPERADQSVMVLNRIEKHPAAIKERENIGAVSLWTLACPNYTIISTKPLRNLADFNGLKIRCTGELAHFFKALGATPVFIPAPETLMGMSRGVVEAAAGSGDYFLKAYRLDDVGKFITRDLLIGGGVTNIFMNKKKYDGLEENVKKIFDKLREEMPLMCQLAMAAPDLLLKWHTENERKGIQYTYFSPKDNERLLQIAKPLWEEWQKTWEDRGARDYFASYVKAKEEVLKEYPNGIPVEYKF